MPPKRQADAEPYEEPGEAWSLLTEGFEPRGSVKNKWDDQEWRAARREVYSQLMKDEITKRKKLTGKPAFDALWKLTKPKMELVKSENPHAGSAHDTPASEDADEPADGEYGQPSAWIPPGSFGDAAGGADGGDGDDGDGGDGDDRGDDNEGPGGDDPPEEEEEEKKEEEEEAPANPADDGAPAPQKQQEMGPTEMGPTNGIPGASMPPLQKPQRMGPTNGATGAHGTTVVARVVEVQDVVPAHGGQASDRREKGVAVEKAVPLEKAVGRPISMWTVGAADTSRAATSTSVECSGRASAAC